MPYDSRRGRKSFRDCAPGRATRGVRGDRDSVGHNHAAVKNAAPNSSAELFFLWLFVLFGAPASHAGAIIALLPATTLLRRLNVAECWALTAVSALIAPCC